MELFYLQNIFPWSRNFSGASGEWDESEAGESSVGLKWLVGLVAAAGLEPATYGL
jgi:hypothetical protein